MRGNNAYNKYFLNNKLEKYKMNSDTITLYQKIV